jgi:hypothetical protein
MLKTITLKEVFLAENVGKADRGGVSKEGEMLIQIKMRLVCFLICETLTLFGGFPLVTFL